MNHAILADFGRQNGLTTVAEAVGDQEGLRRIEEFWNSACRHLPATLDLGEYHARLLERFRNPRIEHLLSQIARDSATKLHYRVAPVALAQLRDESRRTGPRLGDGGIHGQEIGRMWANRARCKLKQGSDQHFFSGDGGI